MTDDGDGGFRCTILYGNEEGAPFDWDHYVPKHLPLAVGTSLRHSRVTDCDAERPLDLGSAPAYLAICVVYFADADAMQRFRRFFAEGHPDTARILADEPNYTTVTPVFVAGEVIPQYSAGEDRRGHYRLRLLLPASEDDDFDLGVLTELGAATLEETLLPNCDIVAAELEHMLGGVGADEPPAYRASWTLHFAAEDDLHAARRIIGAGEVASGIRTTLAHLCRRPPVLFAARVEDFDMQAARDVAASA